MNRKHQQSVYHTNVNVNLVVENVIQIKSGITINIDVCPKIWKNVKCVKNIIFAILIYLVKKTVNR